MPIPPRATFSGASLSKARFDGAVLCGADLSQSIDLTRRQIESARMDKTTKLPDYIELN